MPESESEAEGRGREEGSFGFAWGWCVMVRRVVLVVGVLGVLVAGFGCVGASAALNVTEPFEVVPGSFRQLVSTVQAGAHQDFTTRLDFVHDAQGRTHNDAREIIVNLPAGFSGNNNAVPTCTFGQLLAAGERTGNNCPPASQVGVISFEANLGRGLERLFGPVYNMETSSFGVTAELGLKVFTLTAVLLVSVRPGDAGLTVTSPNIERIGEAHGISLTTWGLPAAEGPAVLGGHTEERGLQCSEFPPGAERVCEFGGEKANIPVRPFLANPTSCGPVSSTMTASSWEEPEKSTPPATAEFELVEGGVVVGPRPISGCERLAFDPSIEAQPSTRAAESPTGLEFTIEVPQRWDEPRSLATAHLKDAVVTLPVGMTINPSAGAGLGACSEAQYAAETSSSPVGVGCPPESKIGTVEIETPVLGEKLEGAVYVATPFENKVGSLLGLYIVAKAPPRGVLVKVAGEVHLDPVTGQLTTSFLNNPQQPFSRFTLKFRPGATAPLASPPVCGSYTIQAALTPWSTLPGGTSSSGEPHLVSTLPFAVTQGVHEGACPSGGVPPLHPLVSAGTQNNAAGSYSPFYLRLIREDGEQELTRFSTVMPPGLTGNLSGVPFCPDAAVEAARARTGPHGGGEEEASPSCPAASQIGRSITSAGVGTVLAQTPGRLYLAGPYHGAPLSLVSVTSAKVGPFDLGTVVIRFALRINPVTSQVEVDASSDAIPHIIRGIVVHVRDIRAYIDGVGGGNHFIENPTSCEHLQIQNTITGAGADPSNPAGQQAVSVTTPFQAANCQNLQFKPSFKASTSGKTSRANGASLTVRLAYPNAPQGTQANIARVKVDLPKQLPSRLTTLQKACTAAQFNTNPAGCPAASFIGHAKAITPILPVPLEGPAIFVSHGGEAFPSLEIVLQGYGITIDLVGSTFISKQGITSSTFKTVPDQPVGSFELTLPEGKFSALAANGNLCASTKTVTVSKRVTRRVHGHTRRVTVKVKQSVATPLAMPTEFVAQNGMTLHQSTAIGVTGCAKGPVKKKGKAKKRSTRRK
jgi:hypothetical protein